jgi:hypothetical protein
VDLDAFKRQGSGCSLGRCDRIHHSSTDAAHISPAQRITKTVTHVALLVSTESTTDSGLGAVSGSVTLFTTVVALHRGSLDSLVLAVRSSVTGLLAVVADVGSASGEARGTTGTTSSARGASRRDVAETTVNRQRTV